ncbi:hypothetical protein DN752_19630 [Echinicola strongylocentroti]|uniref:Phage tail protein n=1 Tax=Echinicola strongylocentroti TaxID=1795355 RepID=A0A2Z4IP96_9BACT|nr:phage tail tube protein [Echinicola strongylocentroti]AWW32173.1 hypothetical protein DN752_19630 [Echinicola strongylocentroti]
MSYNGTQILIKLATEAILGQTSSNLDHTWDMIETTTKQSTARAKTYETGENGWTSSCETKLNITEGTALKELMDAADLGTAHDFESGSGVVDSMTTTGQVLISGISISEPQNDVITVSYTLQGTGPVTRTIEAV